MFDVTQMLQTALSPFIYLAVAAAVILAIVGIVLPVLFGKREEREERVKTPYQYSAKKYFMTRAESECYAALLSAVGNEYYVFPQVHLPAIIDHKVPGQNWMPAFRHINGKSVDFVLCEKSYISPKLAIELDDKTHERADRVERDVEVERILKQAGVPLLRLKNSDNLTAADLEAQIKALI